MAGHTTRNRVICVADFTAVFLQQFTQLAHVVLRLRDGHAVTRHDHHIAGSFQNQVGVLYADGFQLALDLLGGLLHSTEAGE